MARMTPRQRAENQARLLQLLGGALPAAGAGIGALAGGVMAAPAGGVSAPLGAAIGSGIGTAAGSLGGAALGYAGNSMTKQYEDEDAEEARRFAATLAALQAAR